MGKSCFDGYLTPECANCPDWADGSDPKRGIGCACNFPIGLCQAFAKTMEEDERKKAEQSQCQTKSVVCPNCGEDAILDLYDDISVTLCEHCGYHSYE